MFHELAPLADDRIAGIDLVFNPVQPRGHMRGHEQIGVDHGRRRAILHALVVRTAIKLRAIVVPVGCIGGGPGVAGSGGVDKFSTLDAAVAIDDGRRDGRQGADMFQQAADVVNGDS